MVGWKHPAAFTSISDKGLITICFTLEKIASSYFSKYTTIYRDLQENMIIFIIGESLINVSASTLGNLLLLLRAQTDPVLNLNSVT